MQPFVFRPSGRTRAVDSFERVTISRFSPSLDRRVFTIDRTRAACLFLVRGSAVHKGTEAEISLPSESLLWLARGEAGALVVSADSQGHLMTVSAARLDRALPFSALASEIRAQTRRTQCHLALSQDLLRACAVSFDAIDDECLRDQLGASEVIETHLRLLMLMLWRLGREHGMQPNGVPGQLVQRFIAEVDLRLRDHPRIEDLCHTLGVSEDRLARAVRDALGQSPKQVIQARMTREAEKLLSESELRVEEIAALLGFSEPSYFNRFFSRNAGISPARFRRAARELTRAPSSGGYAAWP